MEQGSATLKLPTAVKKQVEKSKKLEQDHMEALRKKSEDILKSTDEPQPAPEVQPETKPEEVKPEVKAEPKKEAKGEEYYAHRIKTMQGMFDAEKSRLKATLAEKDEKISALNTALESLNKRLIEIEKSKPIDVKDYATPEALDKYGADTFEAVIKAAKQVAESKIPDLDAEIDRRLKPHQEELEREKAQIRERQKEIFWSTLEERVPEWSQINEDPRFLEWLSQEDDFSGVQRQDLLSDAQSKLDTNRVVKMFKTFQQSLPAPQPAPRPSVVPESIPANPSTTASAPVVTASDVREFYKNKALGRYKNNPQAVIEFENKLKAAMTAGTYRA